MSVWSRRSVSFFSFLIICALALSTAVLPATATADDIQKQSNPASAKWTNPGGMWMPQQMVANAEILKQLGIEIDPALLSNPASDVMQAIIHLGYCSGSFISPTGLIITNHHCVDGMLSYLSKEDSANGIKKDHVKEGFISRSQQEERNTGPTERVYVTQKVSDITARVLGGLAEIADPAQRTREIERRIKEITRETEKGRAHIRAEVKGFYQGSQYYLIEKLEIKDVRMVYAPPQGVGFFGGDDDNWQWPRQVGDFAILRAYVGKDGQPATYSPDNVPFKPENFLNVSARGLAPDDLVMVAGYPGSTSRLITRDDFEFQIKKQIPLIIDTLQQMVKLVDEMSRKDNDIRIKLESTRFSLMNQLQNREGAYANMVKHGYLEKKEKFEAELRAWIDADEGRRARYGTVLDEIARINQEDNAGYDGLFAFAHIVGRSRLISSAVRIARMAEERQKPDAEREIAYQERNWERLRQAEQSGQKSYARAIDLGFLEFFLKRITALPAAEHPEWLATVLNLEELNQGVSVRSQLERLYSETTLETLETRLALLNEATPESLRNHADPLVKIGYALAQVEKAVEEEGRATEGKLVALTPVYMAALKEFIAKPVAPDANGTLRVVFGRVRGFKHPVTGVYHHPQTTLSSMLKKAKDHDLIHTVGRYYDAPQAIFQAASEKDFGIYGDRGTGEIPLNFLADVDTTGGNSGSAALNKRGELIGLLFDGTLHSLGRDWMFGPDARSILLDIRYPLWLLEKVYKLDHILKEMKIDQPACEDYLSGSAD